jgi:hypothetical protein
VWAEDALTGRVSASNITFANGSYHIAGLLPGNYHVFAQALGGPVSASEIASQRGAYAGLLLNQQSQFRTEELGSVKVAAGATTALNAQLSGTPALLTPSFIGINGQLSTLAVPLAPARIYKIFIAGEGISVSQLSRTDITTSSPQITVDPSSVVDVDFGNGLSVISFDVTVSAGATDGDYSVRLQSLTGEVSYVVGGLTIGDPQTAARAEIEMLIDAIDEPDRGLDDAFGGG